MIGAKGFKFCHRFMENMVRHPPAKAIGSRSVITKQLGNGIGDGPLLRNTIADLIAFIPKVAIDGINAVI